MKLIRKREEVSMMLRLCKLTMAERVYLLTLVDETNEVRGVCNAYLNEQLEHGGDNPVKRAAINALLIGMAHRVRRECDLSDANLILVFTARRLKVSISNVMAWYEMTKNDMRFLVPYSREIGKYEKLHG